MTNSNSLIWSPVPGEQANGVAQRSKIDDLARAQVVNSAVQILGSGIDPNSGNNSRTGLVVGYVQSGKTLSFTTVIGLARDNGFPLVIVIAGNKDNLLRQSYERLERDLDVNGGVGLPKWKIAKNPSTKDGQSEQIIRQSISNWNDTSLDEDEKHTLLITVLKQNQRLQALTTLLSKIGFQQVPVLIVDDEADQASLNTKVNQGLESTTYTRIRELRAALPRHTFLQYTATPQAPLLINIVDTLSPDFVHVLEPGSDYVGGEDFFKPNSPYIQVIPPGDIPPNNALPVDPPGSLLKASREFYVGLAASIIGGTGLRSMLIHPARERDVHRNSVRWATAIKDGWKAALDLPSNDPDRMDVVAEFKNAYDDLLKTASNLPPFDSIIEKLPRALRNTTVIEFNTNGRPKTPEINWRHFEGWILVGGQAVDRGFTVDSLSVTYMPRGIGVGNADTVQQRARFFGYKKRYLGLCRVYLEQNLIDAFEGYVEHEQIMRGELQTLSGTGDNLQKWRRRLVLDPALHPCRRSVISDPYMRQRAGGGWTQQRGALIPESSRQANIATLGNLAANLKFVADDTYASKEAAQKHEIARDVPAQSIIEALAEYKLEDPRDTASFTGILLTLGEAIRSNPNITATIYKMRPTAGGRRDIKDDGTIENFLQGRTDRLGGYPGDTFYQQPNQMTLQLHAYDLRQNGKIVAKAAPLVVFHVPSALARDWLIQVQAGQ